MSSSHGERAMNEKVQNWWKGQPPERQRMLILGGLGGLLLVLMILVWASSPKIQLGSNGPDTRDQVDPYLWGGGRSNVQAVEDLASTVERMDEEFQQMQRTHSRAIEELDEAKEQFLEWTRTTGVSREAAEAQQRLERLQDRLDELEGEAENAEIAATGITPFQPGESPAQESAPEQRPRPEPESPRPEPQTEGEEGEPDTLEQDLFSGVGTSPRQQQSQEEPDRQPQQSPQSSQPAQRTGLRVNGRSLAAMEQEDASSDDGDGEGDGGGDEAVEVSQEESRTGDTRPPRPERPGVESNIPTGSIISGVLLHGMDAPTGSGARGQPVPVLIRITDLSILPNYFSADLVDCHLLGAGHANLSEERAQIRLENLSCATDEGEVVESDIGGYIVGPDGKVGIRGPVVHRNGALLARSLQAGVLSGFGEAIGGRRRGSISISTDGNPVVDSPGQVAEEGLSRGVGSALSEVSQYYLDRASEIYPVVSVEAETPVDIVLNRPLELR